MGRVSVMAKHGSDPKAAARAERLKAALRENLRRRKAQARARAQAPGATEKPQSDDAPVNGAPPKRDA